MGTFLFQRDDANQLFSLPLLVGVGLAFVTRFLTVHSVLSSASGAFREIKPRTFDGFNGNLSRSKAVVR